MATFTQTPNLTSAAYTPVVYVVSGIGTGDRYVLRVNIGGSPVATFKQPANPSGVGIFDISKVLQSYFSEKFVEETTYATDNTGAYLSYQVEAWVETGQTPGTVITDVTRYAVNAYDNWRVLNGDLTQFIPIPGAILCETPGAHTNARYNNPYRFLTNFPETYKVRPDEYKTLSFFAKVDAGGTNFGPNAAPFFVVFTYFLDGVQVAQGAYTLANFRGSSLRTDCQDMTVNLTDSNAITTIGVGPQNQADAGITGSWDSYRVDVMSYNYCDETPITNCSSVTEMLLKADDVIYTANFEIDNSCEKFTPVTVSFMNQYGVRDYYTFNKRNTKQVTTGRNEYTKALGSWSDSTFSIDAQGRGRTVFSSYAETEMTLSTDWMTDAVSEWMRELYMSPSTMAYINGQWEPIVITTQTYEEKTYARQQLFQHEISIKFANNQKIQRG
jgi:hypothetical protein